MSQKLERIIHEESLPGATFEGYARTLTYKIDKNGKLKCYQFVEEGCCLNNEREITRNPLYDGLIGSAWGLAISAPLGATIGLYYRNIGIGIAATVILYLISLPVVKQCIDDIAADKRAWDKYQSSPRLKSVEENGGK